MEAASDDTPARGFSRRRRGALAVVLVVLALLLALWIVRKPIATRFVDRTLAAAKVPARYTIADLGLGGQRLTDVVIGDPSHPDLVADWIETQTRLTLRGPALVGLRAGRVRVRAALVDGRVSLGTIDRLIPKSGAGGIALPKLDVAVEDARMRLATPYGVAGIAVSGSGRLDAGFAGQAAIVAERLAVGDCAVDRVAAAFRIATVADGGGTVRATGPANVARATCGGVRSAGVRSDLDARLVTGNQPQWSLDGRVAAERVVHPRASAARVAGTFAAQGGTRVAGRVALTASEVQAAGARAAAVSLDGDILHDPARAVTAAYRGTVSLRDADASAVLPRLASLVAATAGTPVAPLAATLARSIAAGATRFGGEAQVAATVRPSGTDAIVARAAFASASGAQVRFGGGSGIAWSDAGLRVDGIATTRGGGWPQVRARFVQPRAATPLAATVTMAPYAAGGATLALAPVAIRGGATTRIVTQATLSGPLGDGRVEALHVPVDLRIGRGVTFGPTCTRVAFRRVALSGLTLAPAALRLCPIGDALIRSDARGLRGGARVAATRLAGTLGTTPVAVALDGATLRLADRGFALAGVAARIGAPGRVTRLDLAAIEGRLTGSGVAGRFSGGAGQVANVPLLLSDAAGDWRFADGVLRLDGALGVADAQRDAPRFQPMQARAVALTLANGTISAKGVLHEPTTGTRVADVAIVHALASGTGRADLSVPALAFDKGFQPDLLTRLTFGVVADVRGTVSGTGRIAWTPDGVTSTGTFATAGTDLAAAFGPVTGIAGEIRFTDLLALESAPDQVATIASVNPGIPVTDGTIRYRILPGARVEVAGGAWPFAGGRLTLDPTLLDFTAARERRMTFRLSGVAADRFLQQFDFKNLDATGTFDGILPMVFDDSGGRIEQGRLAVREGGGTIRYVGEVTERDVGFWGNLAFQALKSLRYRNLTLAMDGPLAGEMVTDVRFSGVSQGEGARANFLVRRLQRLPFVFNIRITAPFRGLLDSAQSFYDPRRLIQRNLPALLDDQRRRAAPLPVQPGASRAVPSQQKD